MGTHHHRPHPEDRRAFAGHAHDGDVRAAGPGVRPGAPSRVLAARERLRKRGLL